MPKKGHRAANWTAHEDARLQALRARGIDWPDITLELPGRTTAALRQRFGMLARRVLGIARSARSSPRKANGRIRHTPDDIRLLRSLPAAPPSPLTITAAVFGDPPPGRSALERRTADSGQT